MRLSMRTEAWIRRAAQSLWGGTQRGQFYRRMAAMTRNGLALAKAARALEQRAARKGGRYEPNRMALSEIATRLENGLSFDRALIGWVPIGDISVIAAGVRSGTLPEALARVLESGKVAKRIRNSILKEMFEPGIMMLIVAYLIYLIGTQVVPVMEQVVPVAQWPLSAKLLLPLAFITTGWPAAVLLGGMAIGIFAFLYTLPRWARHGRAAFDKIPPWSVYRVIQGSSWIAGFTSLIQSGERAESALAIQAQRAPRWLSTRLLETRTRLLNGQDIGAALAHTGFDFPDRELIDDIEVFAGHGDFPQVLKRLGEEWMNEQETKISAAIRVIGTFITIGVNVLILLTVVGMNALQTILSTMR